LEKVDRTELESAFSRLNVWRRRGERAPHKTLLVLYALGKCSRGESRLIPYREIDERMRDLLVEFGLCGPATTRSFHSGICRQTAYGKSCPVTLLRAA